MNYLLYNQDLLKNILCESRFQIRSKYHIGIHAITILGQSRQMIFKILTKN